jgi:hypothetical protein
MNSTTVYNDTIVTQSQAAAAKDEKTYSITLTADQRNLLIYTGLAIGGYFIMKSLINAAVQKIQRED